MEILKKSCIAVVVLLLTAFNAKSQTTDDTQKAFTNSYTDEYKGDYTAAISDLQKVYKDDSYEINLRLGWLYYGAKQYDKALNYYQKASDLKQYSVESRLGYVKVANELKSYEKAFEMNLAILKIDPYNSSVNYWVGYSYYVAKEYDVAAKYFELVVNMYPFDYDANQMLGWTYLNLGKTAEAKVLFEKALLNRPGDKSATDGLSKCKL